jgi:hypothetical protein
MKKNVLFLSLKLFAHVWQWPAQVNGVISDETKDHPVAFFCAPDNCSPVSTLSVSTC